MSRLSMRKISEILRQRCALNHSYREIANSLQVSISTISDYIRRAKAVNLTWPLPEQMTEEALYSKLFLPAQTTKKARAPADWEQIHKECHKKGMTLQLLWREYREQQSDGFGYAQFCRIYNKYTQTLNPVMRQSHKAGEKSFVDYAGMTMEWIDISTGEIHTAQVFVGCLGASQFIFTEATASQQLPDWISSHIHMFEYFGGVTEIVVPDNLKSGVTKAHRYDPDINPNYQHLCEHYGTAIVPARAATPKDKAKVENAVGIVERQLMAPLRHRTFTSLAEINAALKEGLKKLNTQPFQKMKTSRLELFESIDKPALKPLPAVRYQYAQWKKATVSMDYHISFEEHFYSVPYQYLRQVVEIRATSKTVECFAKQQRIASHVRSNARYRYTTVFEHMPKAHQAQAEYSLNFILENARKIGTHTLAYIEHMLAARHFPQQAYRACYGLLRLEKRFTATRLEKACTKGLLIGATRYQQIETMLKNHCEEIPLSTHNQIENLTHHNIRGADYYH
jgi:transposase